jgi:MFS family permease
MSDFRRVLAAELVSNFGSMLTRLVIPWIATLSLGATPFDMGLLLVADVAAGVVGALALGTLVDRLAARRVMITADLLRALLVGLLAIVAWRGWVSMPLLLLVAAASGLATMAFELARSAWMATRIDAAALASRNAQLSAAGSVTESVSFGVGGWLYQMLGGALSLAVDAASYVVSALCLARVQDAPRGAGPERGRPRMRDMLVHVRAGVATLAGDPTLRALAWLHGAVSLGASLAGTSYMIYVARDLALEPGTLGMIFAVGGAGSALGAAVAPWLGRRVGGRAALVAGVAVLALGSLLIPLATGAGAFAVGLLAGHQLIGDAGHVVHEIHDRTLRQTLAPRDQLARVDAGIRTVGQAATLAGALGGGALATATGARAALLLAALWFGLAALVALPLARRGAGLRAADD